MLFKLSARNAKRQANDYLVYFVTIILAAALIFAFNGLVDSQEIRQLSTFLDSLPYTIVLASIVVVGIMGWLVHYTMRFMLGKRSRELGTYLLMGLENEQVGRLYLLENLIIGGAALLVGMLLGNVLFQCMRAVLLQMFGLPYQFRFAFSGKVVGLTLLYFALIYIFALGRSYRRIKKKNIHSLIYLERQNEEQLVTKKKTRRKWFLISIVCGVLGTICLLLRNLALGILGAILIFVYLYGFFINFSSEVPAFFAKHPLKKYNGTNLLVFRGLASKMNTMGVTMATIAVLFTATLISEGTGLLFVNQFERHADLTTGFDLFMGSSDPEMDFTRYQEYLNEHVQPREEYVYQNYYRDDDQVMQYIKSVAESYWSQYEKDVVIRYSDYQELRRIQGYPEVTMGDNGYLIHCLDHLKGNFEKYDKTVSVGDYSLSKEGIYTENMTQFLWDGNGRGFMLVVPDESVKAQPAVTKTYVVMTDEPIPIEVVRGVEAIRDERSNTGMDYETIYSPVMVREQNASMQAMVVFPLFYLALVLTMAAATILTIQLLSETNRYREQYELLRKLGMAGEDVRKTLRRQFVIFYSMPTIPPLMISITFMVALGNAFDPGIIKSSLHLAGIVGTALGFFFLIYLIYILVSCRSFKKGVLPVEY